VLKKLQLFKNYYYIKTPLYTALNTFTSNVWTLQMRVTDFRNFGYSVYLSREPLIEHLAREFVYAHRANRPAPRKLTCTIQKRYYTPIEPFFEKQRKSLTIHAANEERSKQETKTLRIVLVLYAQIWLRSILEKNPKFWKNPRNKNSVNHDKIDAYIKRVLCDCCKLQEDEFVFHKMSDVFFVHHLASVAALIVRTCNNYFISFLSKII